MQTAFDPTVHGFRFGNSYPGGAVVAEITRQGRLNDLLGVSLPSIVDHLADAAQNLEFWGRFGLCGGMSWASLDRFFTDTAVTDVSSAPNPGSELFAELVTRQLDSMRGSEMIARCLRWQILPDRPPWWMFWAKGLLQRTSQQEWPILRSSLQRGIPTSLTLIRASGVADPSDNHQVVAIGYDTEASSAAIQIYDPNHPNAKPKIKLTFDQRGTLTGLSQTSGEILRGFFVWDYRAPL